MQTQRIISSPNIGALVVCGGSSSRMGTDKSLLTYHVLPQRYHVYHLLQEVCAGVWLSCNAQQAAAIAKPYPFFTDLPVYKNTGPAAALLTAWQLYPGYSWIVAGCDYPFITRELLQQLYPPPGENGRARAFYHAAAQVYEPLLAYYPAQLAPVLQQQAAQENYSLQRLLHTVHATPLTAAKAHALQSIDTPEAFLAAKAAIAAATGEQNAE